MSILRGGGGSHQVNYLIDKASCSGRGPMVISLLHHLLLGAKKSCNCQQLCQPKQSQSHDALLGVECGFDQHLLCFFVQCLYVLITFVIRLAISIQK